MKELCANEAAGRCHTRDCTRAPMTSSSGALYAYCETCTRRILSAAFAPDPRHVPEWVRRANAGTLVVKDYTGEARA